MSNTLPKNINLLFYPFRYWQNKDSFIRHHSDNSLQIKYCYISQQLLISRTIHIPCPVPHSGTSDPKGYPFSCSANKKLQHLAAISFLIFYWCCVSRVLRCLAYSEITTSASHTTIAMRLHVVAAPIVLSRCGVGLKHS